MRMEGQNKGQLSRWLILLAGCAVNFSLSGTSAFSIFVSPMMELTSWSMSSITLSYTLYNLVLCITGIVVGTFAHKWKSWQVIYTGSVLFALGWLVTGFSTSVFMMQFGFGVLSGIGGGFLYNYTVTNVIKWFPDRKGFVSGILLGCAAVGPVFCAPVATAVLSSMGVLSAYKVMGCIYGVLLLVMGWMIRVPQDDYKPAGWNPQQGTQVSAASTTKDYTWKEMLGTKTFYILYIILACSCTSYMMMLNAAATIGKEQAGMSVAMATLSVTLLALSNFCGRMLFGTISDRLGRYKTCLLAMCINFAAMIAMSVTTVAVPFLILMCLVGACGGALLVMFPPITSEQFGVKNSGLNYSIMFSAYSVASLLGPQIAAHYRSLGSYGPAFICAAGMTAFAAILLLLVMKMTKNN